MIFSDELLRELPTSATTYIIFTFYVYTAVLLCAQNSSNIKNIKIP